MEQEAKTKIAVLSKAAHFNPMLGDLGSSLIPSQGASHSSSCCRIPQPPLTPPMLPEKWFFGEDIQAQNHGIV